RYDRHLSQNTRRWLWVPWVHRDNIERRPSPLTPIGGCSCSASDCRAQPVRGCCFSRRRDGPWWCRGERRARCRGPCGSCCPRGSAEQSSSSWSPLSTERANASRDEVVPRKHSVAS